MANIDERLERIDALIDRLHPDKELYEAFLHASPWGILVVDHKMRIAFTNTRLDSMAGYRPGELIGKHLHTLIPAEDRHEHIQHEREYVRNPKVRTGSHPLKPMLLTKDGERVEVEISLAPAQVRGKPYFFASIRRVETLPHLQLDPPADTID